MMHMKNKVGIADGFTLAEALLTLTIIGLIAALTIPGLKRFSQKETTVMQLKKAYSTMNGALDYAIADDVTVDIAKVGGEDFFVNHMIPKMNVVKQCGSSNMNECVSPDSENLPVQPANAVILSDGSIIANNGMDFLVDVNGISEPNIYGVDIYQYRLEKVRGDNQAAGKFDFSTLIANLVNSIFPKAYAFGFGGPSGSSSSWGGSSSSSFGGSSSSSSRGGSSSSSFGGSSTSSSRGGSSSSSFGGSSSSSSSLIGSSSSSSRGTSSTSSSSYGGSSSSSSRGFGNGDEDKTPIELGGLDNCPKCGYCGNGIKSLCDEIKGEPPTTSSGSQPNIDPCVLLGTCNGDKPPVDHGPFVPGSSSSSIIPDNNDCGSSFGGPNCPGSSSGSSGSSTGSSTSSGSSSSSSKGTSSSSSSSTSGSSGSSTSSGSTSSTGGSSTGSTSGSSTSGSSTSSTGGSSTSGSGTSSNGGGVVPSPGGNTDDITEATNTAGWKFVPVGKTADIMNNNWKIKGW